MSQEVHDFIAISDEAKSYNISFVLWPKLWDEYMAESKKRFNWEMHPFKENETSNIPDEKGIYTIMVMPKIANCECAYLMYVGKTEKQTLRKRFRQYFKEKDNIIGRPKIMWVLNKFTGKNLFFCCTRLPRENNIDKIEDMLIDAFKPPFNEQLGSSITSRAVKAFR